MRNLHLAAAMASALALSTPASAGFFDFTLAPYLGASAGQSTTDITCPAGISCDDKDTAWKAYGGLEVNEYLSMEVGYADLGKVGYSGAKSGSRETKGMLLQLVGTYALNPSFTLIGRGGMNILDTQFHGTIAGAPDRSDTDVVWSAGLGAQYNFTQSVGLRAEWERYFKTGSPAANGGTGEADVDLLSAGLVYKF